MTVDRWKTGGGIQIGDSDKPGGMGIFGDGKQRDDDGTVDRVRDPPRELLPLLYRLRCHAEGYNIKLIDAFVDAGGTHFGTIPTTKFGSCLVVTFHRAGLTEAEILSLIEAYGIGAREPERSAKSRYAPRALCPQPPMIRRSLRLWACRWRSRQGDAVRVLRVAGPVRGRREGRRHFCRQPGRPPAAKGVAGVPKGRPLHALTGGCPLALLSYSMPCRDSGRGLCSARPRPLAARPGPAPVCS